jgi:predicted nuclease with TOPRIM domain
VLSEVDIFITVATPQDNIIDALEAENARLKAELSHTEDRLSEMRKKFDELKVILRET